MPGRLGLGLPHKARKAGRLAQNFGIGIAIDFAISIGGLLSFMDPDRECDSNTDPILPVLEG